VIRKRTIPALAGLACAAFLGVTAPQPTRGAASEPGQEPPAQVTIPEAERLRQNPVPATTESIENGKLMFSSQCTMCHGKSGDGSGDLVARLKLEMPDLTDRGHMAGRTDGELFYTLTQGCQRMPGQKERLKDPVKWDLVNYVRTLAAK